VIKNDYLDDLIVTGITSYDYNIRGKQKIKEVTIMTKRLNYVVIEDNAGGLHLAIFRGNKCIWWGSGYEHNLNCLREDIAALQDGADPILDEWKTDLPEGYTAQEIYDEITSCDYGWSIIADDVDIYPEYMGAMGRIAFDLDE